MACVRKRRGRWVADFRDQHGKRHWETYDTKKEADDRLADRQIEVREHAYIDATTLPTFAAVAEHWLTIKRDHPASTYNFWRSHVELHLVPAFGDRRIDRVLAADIERVRNAKRDGTDGHTRLARATINQLLQTLTAILEYAVSHKYLRSNPGAAVERVRVERRTGVTDNVEIDPKEVLTAEQAGQVIAAAAAGLYRTFITMGLLTGCRSGELLALAWEHVDLEAGTVKITRSLSRARSAERGYGKSTPVFGPPKTPSSNRTLDLAPDLVHALKVWRLQSRYARGEDLIFTNSLGGPLHRAHLHKGLRKALDACPGLPRVDLHGLRHSFASILIQRGHPVSQVSHILGHKNPELTLKVYTHWFKGVSSASTMADLAGAICAPRPASGSNLVAIAETLGAAKAK
jgi:integrase